MKKLLALSTALLLTGCFDYSDGDRTGTITKFSRKGIFCKTWEGEMNLGGMRKQTNLDSKGNYAGTSMVANVWQFTVEDKDANIIPKIQESMQSGNVVTLHYRQELASICRSDSDNYFVNSIK